MIGDRHEHSNRAVWWAVLGSVGVHAFVLLAFLPPSFDAVPRDDEKTQKEKFEVSTVVEPDEVKKEEPDQPEEIVRETPDALEEPDQEKKREVEKKEEKKEPEEFEKKDLNRKAVVQQTNEQVPEEAQYLSQEANKTDKETRARKTTTENVAPGKPQEVDSPSKSRRRPESEPGAMARKST